MSPTPPEDMIAAMMASKSRADRHPIQVVTRRTGITPDVLRIWERRYRAVEPQRTPTGRRLYSDADVERLLLLRRATQSGRSIGQVAGLPLDDLRRMVETDERGVGSAAGSRVRLRPDAEVTPLDGDSAEAIVARCFDAAERLDAGEMENVLTRASVSMSRVALIEHVLSPLMKRIGNAWHNGELRIAQEHVSTAVVRSFVGSFLEPPTDTTAHLLVTTPAGQGHEIGALLAAASASAEGWGVTYLGPNLPAEEIAAATHQRPARALVLSIVHPGDDTRLLAELKKLGRLKPPDLPVLVGGQATEAYASALDEIGAHRFADLRDFRRYLATLRASHGSS